MDKVSDDGDLGKYLNFQIVSYAKKFPSKRIFTIC